MKALNGTLVADEMRGESDIAGREVEVTEAESDKAKGEPGAVR